MSKNPYPYLLSPIKVGNTLLRNRLLSSPSMPHFHQGPETYPGEAIIQHFANRAKAGAAVVCCSGTKQYKQNALTSHFMQCDLFDPKVQNYFCQMADAIHFYGAKAALILDSPVREGYDVSDDILSFAVAGEGNPASYSKELTREMLYEMADEYADQCAILKKCGFDMVFVHMSYRMQMPARFLSPLTNHRTDEFGGSIENRAKYPLMILEKIRECCGKDFLLQVSLSAIEPEGGLTLDETTQFVRMAAQRGLVDIIQIRDRYIDPAHPTGLEMNPTPFRELAKELKKRVSGCNVLIDTIGGYQDPDICEEIIRNGEADLISMARSWISNPDYGTLLYENRAKDIVPCIRCNKCHISSLQDPYLSICSVNPLLGLESHVEHMIFPAHSKKKVAVVGGGPGGMKAALVCRERGHEVTLYEQSGQLGGLLIHADYCDFKWPLKQFKEYLIDHVYKAGIHVRLNTKANRDLLEKEQYEEVILAIGSHPILPSIPGADTIQNKIYAATIFGQEENLADQVIVIGGGEIGAETALHLARCGHQCTLIEMREEIAMDACPIHYRAMFLEALEKEENLKCITNARCIRVSEHHVEYRNENGAIHEIEAGNVLFATGMKADPEEVAEFYSAEYRIRAIGDCAGYGNIQKVMRSALGAASQV